MLKSHAYCAAHAEKNISGGEGAAEINVSLLTNSVTVEFAHPATASAFV